MSTKLKLRNIDGWLMARKSVKGGEYTHTKIGDKDSGIIGGTYNIPDSDKKPFLKSTTIPLETGVKHYLTENS